MSREDEQERLGALVDTFNRGELGAFGELLDEAYYDYTPRPGEQTQREAFQAVAEAVRSGFPDATLHLSAAAEDGDDLIADAVFAGRHTGTLFGVPGHGQQLEVRGVLRSRLRDSGLALAFEGVDLLPTLRIAGVVPYPSFAHLKPEHPVQIPEVILRLAFNGGVLEEKACAHLDQVEVVEVTSDTCQECVAEGTEWPALRQCLTCGHVGCCDVSINKHAKGHHEETGHPLVRSAMPGEAWMWCYPDGAFLSSWHLRDR